MTIPSGGSGRKLMLNTAILMLACRDYEALDIALAAHVKFLQPEVHFYILHCRGTYDAERTLGVAKRYARLFPRTIRVIDEFERDTPFVNISRALLNRAFEDYDFVCKADEDVFPLTSGRLYDYWRRGNRSAEIGHLADIDRLDVVRAIARVILAALETFREARQSWPMRPNP